MFILNSTTSGVMVVKSAGQVFQEIYALEFGECGGRSDVNPSQAKHSIYSFPQHIDFTSLRLLCSLGRQRVLTKSFHR